jgi:hypothetical protein
VALSAARMNPMLTRCRSCLNHGRVLNRARRRRLRLGLRVDRQRTDRHVAASQRQRSELCPEASG